MYPEPKRLRPDRGQETAPPPYAYLPYGAGPRTCLGMPFAERALRSMLLMILQRFSCSIPAGTRIDRLTRGNILQPRRPLGMLIEAAGTPRREPAPISGDIHDLVH